MHRRDVAAVAIGIAVLSVVLVAPNRSVAQAAALPAPAPHAVAAPDGAVWSTDPSRDRVIALGASGVVTKTVSLPAGSHPNDIALGSDGALWVTEPGANAIARITMAGVVTSYPVPTVGAEPWGIAAVPSGLLFFTERAANKIGAVIPSKGIVAEKALTTADAAPSGIVAGADGNAWIAEAGVGRIGHYVTGVVVDAPLPSAAGTPNDVTLGADGSVWVTEPGVNKLAKVPTTGAATEVGLPSGAAPAQITTGQDGAIWVAEPGLSEVARVVGATVTQRSVKGHRAGIAAPADGSLSLFDTGTATPLRMTGVVTVAAPCSAGPVCIGVDGSKPGAAVTHVAQGVLHSAVNPAPAASLVTQLAPTAWRISGLDEAPVASASNAVVTYVLSDHWYDQTYGQSSLDPNGQVPPWSDPDGYQTYVRNEVAKVLASGMRVDYFEVQNEPGGSCCGTVDQQLQEFQLAYDAIKSVDPSLKVMGPSLAAFADAPYPAGGYRNSGHDLDLATFLDFAKAQNEHWDALAWHENDADVSLEINSVDSPNVVADHLRRVRALLAQHPEAGSPALVVNEYGGIAQRSPGWDVGYAAALEQGGATSANHACWSSLDSTGTKYSECRDGSMDGLLQHGGLALASRGLAAAFYASMAGSAVPVATTDPGVTGLATVAGTSVNLLFGRHVGCFPAGSDCSAADLPAPRSVTVSVRVPSPVARNYTVTVQHIVDGVDTPTVTTTTVAARSGIVSLSVGTVGEGDAVSVAVRPV
ncbi:MAG TPA: hypothetical protein VFH66_12450 [Mycobacteriales bacterium]|nr:hypothetical protein [Mycobacteriales bacterium]